MELPRGERVAHHACLFFRKRHAAGEWNRSSRKADDLPAFNAKIICTLSAAAGTA